MLPLWKRCNVWICVRQHPGSRAYHRAGGCPDALAPQGPNSHDVDFELRLVLAGLALAEAIAVAVHLEDVHVVGQPIKKCAGQAL